MRTELRLPSSSAQPVSSKFHTMYQTSQLEAWFINRVITESYFFLKCRVGGKRKTMCHRFWMAQQLFWLPCQNIKILWVVSSILFSKPSVKPCFLFWNDEPHQPGNVCAVCAVRHSASSTSSHKEFLYSLPADIAWMRKDVSTLSKYTACAWKSQEKSFSLSSKRIKTVAFWWISIKS